MVISNLFSKVWLNGLLTLLVPPVFGRQKRAQYSIFKYAIRLRRKSDDEIRASVNHERGLRAWCSERSYYLAALRYECKRRGLEYEIKMEYENSFPRKLTLAYFFKQSGIEE